MKCGGVVGMWLWGRARVPRTGATVPTAVLGGLGPPVLARAPRRPGTASAAEPGLTCCLFADKADGSRGSSLETRCAGREGSERAPGVQDPGAGGEHVLQGQRRPGWAATGAPWAGSPRLHCDTHTARRRPQGLGQSANKREKQTNTQGSVVVSGQVVLVVLLLK